MTPNHHDDDTAAERLTGRTASQLAVQVAGGLLLAIVVGAVSAWGTQQVLGERIVYLTREVQQLRDEVQQIRRDLYRPHIERGALAERNILPPGRP